MGNNQSRSSTANEEPHTPNYQQDSASLAQLFARNPDNSDRDVDSLEQRRNAKLEKEARRAEREKVARENERERSMKEESVDGGYLVTQGVYTGVEDFSKPVVRQLMIERKLAPFWRGLQDFSPSWTEYQLVAVARGKPLPAADDIPEEEPEPTESGQIKATAEQASYNLAIPMSSRSFSTSSNRRFDEELGTKAKIVGNNSISDSHLREIRLPHEANYKGQPIEAYLYKDATECPICFLYYPNWQNKTRCCLQDICSECFVQVARKAPHLPEGEQPQGEADSNRDAQLISTPACCPYCSTPEMGVFYTPPPFSRGLAYVHSHKGDAPSAPQQFQRGRAASLAVTNERVISTDRIRPDFETILLKENLIRSRRNAAATALHTAAYLMNGRGTDSRLFGRRNVLRRGQDSPGASPNHLSMLAMMADRYEAANQEIAEAEANSPSIMGPPRQSSRRNRMDDLEDMMMMEAIRLSLAAEQERQQREQKQEEKNKKKAEKQKAKDDKKAEKALKKSGLYLSATNSSSQVDDTEGKGKEAARPLDIVGRTSSAESPQSYLERSRAQILVNDSPQSSTFPSMPFRSSHLRNMSGVSSSASSFVDTSRRHAGSVSSVDVSPNASGTHLPEQISGTPPGGGAGLEPMFNFRSLAAMIDDEDKSATSPLVEHHEHADELLSDPLLDESQDASTLAQAHTSSDTRPLPANDENTIPEDHPFASKEINISKEALDKETSGTI